MKQATIGIIFSLTALVACEQASSKETAHSGNAGPVSEAAPIPEPGFNPKGHTIETRFLPPAGFKRPDDAQTSFAAYLRTLPLKPAGATVKHFDGSEKHNYDVYEAVVNLPIGKYDLHQCADAVIRLRAEHLYRQQQYDQIHFNFTNGMQVDYSEWMKGNRIKVNGNQTTWIPSAQPGNSYDSFWKYLETIFTYAGTLSLSRELKPVDVADLKTGDVFIRGGSPGHAVIVVDEAINLKTKQKIFLLAQSYMPAQEIQLLKNPNHSTISPWYSTDFEDVLVTPEWTFHRSELMRFE